MSLQTLLDEGFRLDWFEKMPVGLYLVSVDGTLLKCNARALRLFGVTREQIADRVINIANFYADPEERERLQRKVIEAELEGRILERQVVHFRVGEDEHDLYVEITSTGVRAENGEIAGYIDCVTDVTREVKYNRLFDSLSEGVFQIDADDSIVRVNKAVANLFGYSSADALAGLKFQALFADASDATVLRSATALNSEIAWTMVRRGGEQFFATISVFPIISPDGSYNGLEGTIRDVTVTEQYSELLSQLPLGSYLLRRRGGQDYVQKCNRAFALLFGYDTEKQVIGRAMVDLHADTRKYDDFLKMVAEADAEGNALINRTIRIKRHDNRLSTVQVSCRQLRDHDGEVVGRVGVIRDVTEEEPMKRLLHELTSDIGNMLHSYSATLHTVVSAVAPSIETLLRHPSEEFSSITSSEVLFPASTREAMKLAQLTSAFVDSASNQQRSVPLIPADRWEWLITASGETLIEQADQSPEIATSVYYEIASGIHQIFSSFKGHFDRTTIRAIQNQAWLVERMSALYSLLRAREAAVIMEYSSRALREYIIRSERPEEPVIDLKVHELLQSAILNVVDFALIRKIRIERRNIPRTITVKGIERDMVRAIANLLHNAIKYSWHRESGEPWIDIRVTSIQPPGRAGVQIEIENYGVPIPRDELESKAIFRFGFRGRFASERRRTGTGVGLTDAYEVITRQGGTLRITSRPARPTASRDDYSQPFVTTAIVFLPLTGW